MKKLSALFLIAIIFITGCQPSENAIQTAIVQTQNVNTPFPKSTNTPIATFTPSPTNTLHPTNTLQTPLSISDSNLTFEYLDKYGHIINGFADALDELTIKHNEMVDNNDLYSDQTWRFQVEFILGKLERSANEMESIESVPQQVIQVDNILDQVASETKRLVLNYRQLLDWDVSANDKVLENIDKLIDLSEQLIAETEKIPTDTQIPTELSDMNQTPTVSAPDCINWTEVTTAMIGQEVCVYGIVYKSKSVGESTRQILFSDDQKAFFLAGGTYMYFVGSGDCVVAQGQVLSSFIGVPYIDIDEALYKCEPWMK
ncbi:MAG: hypothetical protein HOP27_14355 [Anaerolineales bacterium]|nr:hypothetical protein [Anaerolineales bacterium]